MNTAITCSREYIYMFLWCGDGQVNVRVMSMSVWHGWLNDPLERISGDCLVVRITDRVLKRVGWIDKPWKLFYGFVLPQYRVESDVPAKMLIKIFRDWGHMYIIKHTDNYLFLSEQSTDPWWHRLFLRDRWYIIISKGHIRERNIESKKTDLRSTSSA